MANINKVGALSKFQVPVEVAKALFLEKKHYCLPLYQFATRHKRFSGIITKKKIPMMAKLLRRSETTVFRQLRVLVDEGLATYNKGVWMFFSADKFAATRGKAVCYRTQWRKGIKNNEDLAAFVVSIIQTEQFNRIEKANQKKNSETRQDDDEALKVEISNSYTANYLAKEFNKKVSPQYISRMRRKAKAKEWIGYNRQIGMHRIKDRSGNRLKNKFTPICFAKQAMEEGNAFIRGNFLLEELPAVYNLTLSFSKRGVSNALKAYAQKIYQMRL